MKEKESPGPLSTSHSWSQYFNQGVRTPVYRIRSVFPSVQPQDPGGPRISICSQEERTTKYNFYPAFLALIIQLGGEVIPPPTRVTDGPFSEPPDPGGPRQPTATDKGEGKSMYTFYLAFLVPIIKPGR